MRFKPQITNGLKDAQIRQLFEFALRLFGVIPEYNIYTLTTVWHAPFTLLVPTNGNTLRIAPPDVVRLARVQVVGDERTPVYYGSVQWEFVGNGSVRIYDAEGLMDGVKYNLTFEVISES